MIQFKASEGADETTRQVLGVHFYLKQLRPRSAAAKARLADLARAPFLPPSVWRRELERLERLDEVLAGDQRIALGAELLQLPTLERPLRRLDAGEALVDGELFEVKRFLFYGLAVLRAADGLDGLPRPGSEVVERLQELMGAIHPEQVPTARFYLVDELDERLREWRSRLARAQRGLREHRRELEEAVLGRQDGRFDLKGRFIPAGDSLDVQDPQLVYREGAYWLDDQELGELFEEQEGAIEQVEQVEGEVRRRLSELVGESRRGLEAVAEELTEFDLRLARVELRRRIGGCWPREIEEEQEGDLLRLEVARSPVLVEVLGEEAVQAIDVELDEGATVVVGPNMGGKSALLRLVGLMQWSAQMGLPLPAKSCAFRHLSRVVYIGAEEPRAAEDGQSGLSSFGREVSRFVEYWEEAGPILWLLDEPGRGTHPEEGARLTKEILDERLARGDQILIATHFPQLTDHPEYSLRRIEGLKVSDDILSEALQRARVEGADLQRVLGQFMDYRVSAVEHGVVPRDAERVARALGLRLRS